ncbi:hypothetical protein [Streptomyces sp. NBC_01198]|uniref:hypothetical protein n=1 Tax=Streptomyces sp. NBC_01198 TaxID=2903769 RepID=UPI002E100B4A|nr:hypothetical protein OG702_17540 [Streptomyces sp. NBC_01198]
MTDRDGIGEGRSGAEDELRVLLERAVPQLPAPPQRLERVRERMRRRRRRRAAAVTGSAVLAVVAVLAAVPGLLRPQGGGQAALPTVAASGPAGKPTAPADHRPTMSTPAPTTDGGYQPDGMDGLRLRPPQGWRILADPATTSVFLSSQTLVLPEKGCAHALDGFCTPLARVLAGGGALVMFRSEPVKMQGDILHGMEQPLADAEVTTACHTVNGTRQLSRTMVRSGGTSRMVWATACLSHPSPAQLAQVSDLLASADFG